MSRLVPSAVVILIIVVALPLDAEIFYVATAPIGDDSNPGTSIAPWATLQHAADTVQPGDSVVVRAGSYAGAQLTTSGTVAQPITFAAETGALVEIVADNSETPDGINIEGANYQIIEGFTVNGRTRAGIRAVLCEGVTIRNNRCDANGRWGIFTGFCDDLVIEGNHTSNSVAEHGIYVSNSGDRPIIRRNRIWGNLSAGIHMNGDVSQGGDGVISEALVEENVIFDNGVGGASGINMDGVQNSLVRNNLIYDSHASGISLYQIDGGDSSDGNRILNNTILVASDGRWALNIRDGSNGNTIFNNILYSAHSFRGAMSVCDQCLPGMVSDYNIVEDRFTLDDGDSVVTLAQWQATTALDSNSLLTDLTGVFADLAGDDYHLADGSLAVDRGTALVEVPTDIEATPRPLGIGWDIGAFEGEGAIFADGFESGDLSRWAGSLP